MSETLTKLDNLLLT